MHVCLCHISQLLTLLQHTTQITGTVNLLFGRSSLPPQVDETLRVHKSHLIRFSMDCSLTWISTCKNESTGINKQRQPHQVDTETVAKNHQRLRSAQLDPPIAGALISSNLRLSSYSLIIIFFTFYLTPSKHRVCSLCSGQIALYSVNKAFRLPCLSPEWNTNDLSKWYSCSPQKPIAFIMEAL